MKTRHKVSLLILVLFILFIVVYTHFGGFGTGPCADVHEFSLYARDMSPIEIPKNVRFVALGEATHGTKEFQALRKDVFQNLVEKNHVRAFALEADFGGCERVNRYIHGASDSVEAVVQAIGFQIYCTRDIIDLIEYMRAFNAEAQPSDAISFYGFDMQRCGHNCRWILALEEAKGNHCVMLAAHNSHISKFNYYSKNQPVLGTNLKTAFGDEYFCIGTDFYRGKVNLPTGKKHKRTTVRLFSHDPLAKAAMKAGFDTCYLRFSDISDDSNLKQQTTEYTYMVNRGEGPYLWFLQLIPQSYRSWVSPAKSYDAMIFVSKAAATEILSFQ